MSGSEQGHPRLGVGYLQFPCLLRLLLAETLSLSLVLMTEVRLVNTWELNYQIV